MRLRLLHLMLLVALVALVALVVGISSIPPAAKPFDAPAEEFSASRALEIVSRITSSGLPHPTGSADNERVRRYIVERLQALGLESTEQVANVCREGGVRCAQIHNVLARIEGTETGPALMLVAHYDSTERGPGAADDGAGVATILEIVRILRLGPRPRRTVIALLDDGEELGLFGAKAFVGSHGWAKDVGVVLNFEARGSSGPTAMFEASSATGWLVEEYLGAVSRPFASSLIYTLYKLLPNDTDLTVFKVAGMSGLNFAFADRVSDYHTANDTVARLDPRSVQHMGDQGLEVTRALVRTELRRSAGSDVVYFDLFTRGAVSYQTGCAVPLAALGFAAALIAIVGVVRGGRASMSGVAYGVGVQFATVAAGGAAVFTVPFVIEALANEPKPWWTDPRPTWEALLAVALAAGSGTEISLGRHLTRAIGPTEDGAILALWAGATIFWTILSLTVALIAPAASYLFTLPATAIALGLLLVARVAPNGSDWHLFGGLSLGVGVTALLWTPVVWVLRVMVGSMLPPVGAFPAALMVTAAAPVFLAAPPRVRRWIPMAAAAMMAVAIVRAMVR